MKSKRMFSTTVGKGSLSLCLETRGEAENNVNTDTRLAPAEKNIGFQQMPTPTKHETLDPELRKYFGFGKKSFKTIVKKPGNKFGFKLNNYIAPTDSIATVNEILFSIAQHREYIKSSPVKEVFNKKFKDNLRANFFQRHPKKYLIKLHLGVTLLYKTKEGFEKVDTNRERDLHLHTNSVQYT